MIAKIFIMTITDLERGGCIMIVKKCKIRFINPKEIITENSLDQLRKKFGTPESYLKNIKVLDVTRNLVFKQMVNNGWDNNPNNELAPLFETLNNLYSALYDTTIEHKCKEYVSCTNNRKGGVL